MCVEFNVMRLYELTKRGKFEKKKKDETMNFEIFYQLGLEKLG